MLRIRGDRQSLITALVGHWLDQALQLPAAPTPAASTSPRRIEPQSTPLARPAPATEH